MSLTNEFKKYATRHLNLNAESVDQHLNRVNSFPNITGFTPQVIEERQLNVVGMDVFSRLMMDRIIFLVYPLMIMLRMLFRLNCSF